MYAIIETGGKQVKVEAGQSIYVELLNDAVIGETYTFNKVLFVVESKLRLVLHMLKVLL